jgi:hypothetical protein
MPMMLSSGGLRQLHLFLHIARRTNHDSMAFKIGSVIWIDTFQLHVATMVGPYGCMSDRWRKAGVIRFGQSHI